MAKSQLNQLSKRQILESLMQEQNQSNVTLSRLITAVARTANIDPTKLAELFVDDKGNQDYVETFNKAVREKHTAAHKEENAEITDDTFATAAAGMPDSETSTENNEEEIK